MCGLQTGLATVSLKILSSNSSEECALPAFHTGFALFRQVLCAFEGKRQRKKPIPMPQKSTKSFPGPLKEAAHAEDAGAVALIVYNDDRPARKPKTSSESVKIEVAA